MTIYRDVNGKSAYCIEIAAYYWLIKTETLKDEQGNLVPMTFFLLKKSRVQTILSSVGEHVLVNLMPVSEY